MIKWRLPYDDAENQYYDELTSIDFTGDPGLTLQAPADEQDLNIIMARFGVTDGSKLPYWQDQNAIYGDFSEMPSDPVEAAEILRLGEVAFMTLPAKIRRNFDSGAHLHNWLTDPKNTAEAIQLGLMQEYKQPATIDTLQSTLVSMRTSSDKETTSTGRMNGPNAKPANTSQHSTHRR